MTMELTRRDALVALSGGTALATTALLAPMGEESPDGTVDDDALSTLDALTDVIYPSEVTTTTAFI